MEASKLSWGEVKDGFLEEVASKLGPKRYIRCHGKEDTIPAFMEFCWVSKYRGIYHTMWLAWGVRSRDVGASPSLGEGLATQTKFLIVKHFLVGLYLHPFTQSPETHIWGDCCLGTDYGHRTKELIQDLGDTRSSHFPVMLASFLYKSYAPAYIWASRSPSFLCIRIAHMIGFYLRLIESKSLGE